MHFGIIAPILPLSYTRADHQRFLLYKFELNNFFITVRSKICQNKFMPKHFEYYLLKLASFFNQDVNLKVDN
jgi:hypothetical protein